MPDSGRFIVKGIHGCHNRSAMEAFHSKSEALGYIEFGIERGQYQNCGKLTVVDSLNMRYGRRHHPCCTAHSLGKNDSYRAVASTYCPEGCHFFVPKEEFLVEQKRLTRWRSAKQACKTTVKMVGTVILAPFRYFQKLPALVQSLIIILLIVWLFPKFKGNIIEILKVLKN